MKEDSKNFQHLSSFFRYAPIPTRPITAAIAYSKPNPGIVESAFAGSSSVTSVRESKRYPFGPNSYVSLFSLLTK